MKMNSKKIKLGKTGDSRTRGKAKPETAVTLSSQTFTGYLLSKGLSSKTAASYIKDTERFRAWAKQENIEAETASYADLLHYLQSYKNKIKQRTLAQYLAGVKHYFDYLAETGERADNPASRIEIRGIKRKTLYHILSRQELDQLYGDIELLAEEAAYKTRLSQTKVLASRRDKVMVGLMVYQGLNSHELAQLKEADLKLREGKIYIAGTRRSNERDLKLEAHQILDIMEYQRARKELLTLTCKATDTFFPSTGRSLESFGNVLISVMKKLIRQNPKVSSQRQIRTSVITHWLKQYNLRQAQYMAGHRYVSTTEGYQINDMEDMQEEIGRYHPIG